MSPSSETTGPRLPVDAQPSVHEATVVLPANLHARPAGQLVVAAGRFASEIQVVSGEKSANARSVLAVMGLGATAGTEIVLRATGDDADEALAALVDLLAAAR